MAKKLVLVIQQGGTSRELYTHAHATLKEALADRKSCEDGAYATTKPITLPPRLTKALLKDNALESEFYAVLDTVLEAAAQLH